MRRASIPIVMSKGFNPHPKFSIPLALSVGISGKDEVLELELLGSIPPEMVVQSLRRQLPKGIHILSGVSMPDTEKGSACDVVYEVIFKDRAILKTIQIGEFLQQPSITVHRIKDGQQKLFNIRPSIQEISVEPDRLILFIKMGPAGMARPEEVVHSLLKNEKRELFEIIRTKVNLSSSA